MRSHETGHAGALRGDGDAPALRAGADGALKAGAAGLPAAARRAAAERAGPVAPQQVARKVTPSRPAAKATPEDPREAGLGETGGDPAPDRPAPDRPAQDRPKQNGKRPDRPAPEGRTPEEDAPRAPQRARPAPEARGPNPRKADGAPGKSPSPDAPAHEAPGPGKGRQGKGKARGATPAQPAPPPPVPPPVSPARARPRHGLVLVLFLLMVILPVSGAAWYLYVHATDQYASTLGFSVRKEEGPSASELLGGIASLTGGASSSDTDVLNEFIQSQEMVERVDATLGLRAIYSEPQGDPLFTVDADATIEDLVDYWNRMVTVYYDGGIGLIEVRVLAFDPQDSRAIAQEIFDESSRMINDLTAIARADATRYARQELEAAVERLREARAALTEFRTRTQIVDPAADIQGQMGLLNTLQAQLAESLIELDLLSEVTRENDPRVRQTEQRIAVIQNRIAEERAKFGISDESRSGETYATLVGEYESLVVNREFAESAYLTALTNFDIAQAEAQRQSRYLAAHIKPTLAQSSEYPQRVTILATFALFAAMAWATASLIYYSIRDRR